MRPIGQDSRVTSRVDTSMTPGEINDYLTLARTIILTTIGPDGVPDPVGMWFVLRDDEVWMRTYGSSQKALNVIRDPRVAVLIESGEQYAQLRGLQLTGTVDVVRDEDVICEIAADLLVKYEGLAPEHVAAARAAYRAKTPKQVALKLQPTKIVSWDHRKLMAAQ